VPEGAFHRWLVETQIEPTFRDHPFVQSACVLVVMCTREYFAEWTRSPEYGCYEGLDAFAVYAVFERTSTEVACVRVDKPFGERIDRFIPAP
jgi:hypothetical protein